MLCEIDLFNPKELITQGKQFNSNKKKENVALGEVHGHFTRIAPKCVWQTLNDYVGPEGIVNI